MPTGQHDRYMGTNHRRLDMLEKRARDAVSAKAAREAKRVVGIWNARHAANRDLWSIGSRHRQHEVLHARSTEDRFLVIIRHALHFLGDVVTKRKYVDKPSFSRIRLAVESLT